MAWALLWIGSLMALGVSCVVSYYDAAGEQSNGVAAIFLILGVALFACFVAAVVQQSTTPMA